MEMKLFVIWRRSRVLGLDFFTDCQNEKKNAGCLQKETRFSDAVLFWDKVALGNIVDPYKSCRLFYACVIGG